MHLLAPVRAHAQLSLSIVAVVTQHLKSFRKVVIDKPSVQGCAACAYLGSMRAPIVIHVIDTQEDLLVFTATSAR